LAHHQAVTLERATWQHDIGVTARHLVLIESPTEPAPSLVERGDPVPYRWLPGEPTWVAVVPRDGDGTTARWFRLDPCLVTHVLHAHDDGDDGDAVVLYVCCYPVPEKGQPVDLEASVLGSAGIGQSLIGGALCEGVPFRYGYCVEVAVGVPGAERRVDHLGLLRFDTARDEVARWSPGSHRTAGEPLFVRSVDGHGDDEGWLLTVVHDATRGASDLYILDASSLSARSRPQAVVHLPVALPFASHGAWVGADQYR
jgi:carotenoid cleavage dioxygenase